MQKVYVYTEINHTINLSTNDLLNIETLPQCFCNVTQETSWQLSGNLVIMLCVCWVVIKGFVYFLLISHEITSISRQRKFFGSFTAEGLEGKVLED